MFFSKSMMQGKSLLFVQGMDPAGGVAMRLHIGADQLLEPPFGPGGTKIYPWRPLNNLPKFKDWTPENLAFTAEPVLQLAADGRSQGFAQIAPTPRLSLDHNLPTAFGNKELMRLRDADPYFLKVKPGYFRVVIFTGHGFTGRLVEADTAGRISIRNAILNHPIILFPLRVALDLDRKTEFRLLIQSLDQQGKTTAARLLPLCFKPDALKALWP